MEDAIDVGVVVAPGFEDRAEGLQTGDRGKVVGGLLVAKPAIEIAANADVTSISNKLADMVNVVGDGSKRNRRVISPANLPPGLEHPGIQSHSNHRISVNQRMDLFVRELAIGRDESSAHVVAGVDRAGEAVEDFKESGVGTVGEINDHSQVFELVEECATGGRDRTFAAGAHSVSALAIVRQTNAAQTGGKPFFGLGGRGDRICPFHRKDDAERLVGGGRGPGLPVAFQIALRTEEAQVAFLFEGAIVGELALRHSIRHRLRSKIQITTAESVGRTNFRFGAG